MQDHGHGPAGRHEGGPAISVIIPVRNGAHVIDEQLDALAAQPFDRPWELIVADNGSTDSTRDLVLGRRASFPGAIRVVDAGARPGVAFARNAGIRAARADRVAICDADDRVGHEWLAGAYESLDTYDVAGGPLRRYTEPFDPDSPLLPYTAVSEESVSAGNIAMRRPVVERAGGFDAAFTAYGREDYEFTVRLRSAGARIGYEPRMLLYYRLTPNQLAFARKVYLSCVADVTIWRRHPDVFPGRQGRGFVVREALSLPLNLVRAARAGGPRRMARVAVSLAAHARTMLGRQAPMAPAMLLRDMPETPEVQPV